jgi:hypothetical protein
MAERLRRSEHERAFELNTHEAKRLDPGRSIRTSPPGEPLGNKLASRSNVAGAASVMRGAGRATKEKSDIENAQEDRAAVQQQLADLEVELKERQAGVQAEFDATRGTVETTTVAPRRADVLVESLCPCWEPV